MAEIPVCTATAIRLYLALLLSPRPVSLAQCGRWGFAPFGELLRLLSEAAERGWVSEVGEGASGRFFWTGPAGSESLFAEAKPEDWRAVLDGIDFGAWGGKAAREAVQRGDLPRARVLYWALVVGQRAAAERLEGAPWLECVLEALRLFRREVGWLSAPIQRAALEQAVALGDRPAEAVLLSTCAYEQLRGGRAGEAEVQCERALELSAPLDDAESRQHTLLYVANCWMLLGRLPEALSMLESFVGDVPADLQPPPSPQPRDTLTEASLATLANAYAWTGNDERALDLLYRMLDAGNKGGPSLLAKMASVYLAWFHADRDELEPAERFARAALELLEPGDAYGWFAAQPMAWVWMKRDRPEQARAELLAGHASRQATGHIHFQNSFVLDVLGWLEERGVEPIEGLTLDGELERLLCGPDSRMAGVAHRVRAQRLGTATASDDERVLVDRHLETCVKLLRGAGAVPELARSLRWAVRWAEEQGRTDEVQKWRAQLGALEQAGATGTAASALHRHLRESHLARAIVDIGRLGLLAHRREGFFGDIAARICRELAVERCALFDTTGPIRLLAARGGDRHWLGALESLLQKERPTAVQFLPPPDAPASQAPVGQLVLIPYRIDDLDRHGWVCLENRRRPARVGPEDRALLESLGVQMSVLIGNVELWEELRAVRQRLERENRYYREESPARVPPGPMVGESVAFVRMLELVAKVAPSDSAALITGETGVGKELVAREILRLSSRRDGPFIVVHVASMPSGLVASALFGHERGAFTGATRQLRGRFELAHGGTIFLDEIGELSPEDQVRLLRVLQEGTFERVGGSQTLRSDFRLLAATNRDLEARVAEGRFRQDLFYRLNVFPIHVPPLRDRRDDIARLALHFLDRFGRQAGRGFEGIGEADVDRLLGYDWPGNVRELEHVIERAVVLSEPPMLKIPSLDEGAVPLASGDRGEAAWPTLEQLERRYVRDVLNNCEGRITGKGGAAEILGLKPSTLQSRIDKLGLRGALKQARAQEKARELRGPGPRKGS